MKILRKPSKRTVLALLLAAAAATYLLGPRAAAVLRRPAEWVLVPLGDAAYALTAGIKSLLGMVGTPEELHRLRRENAELRGRLVQAEGDLARRIKQAQELDRLYGLMRDFPCALIPARVASADSLPYGQTRLVNVGASRGARPGARVTTRLLITDRSKALPEGLATISATALAGTLMETGAFTARLRLVTDAGFRIPATVYRIIDPARPRKIKVLVGDAAEQTLRPENNQPIPVLAVGDGAGAIKVEGVYAYHNVRPKDWLVTRGDSAFLPAQVKIGRVEKVTAEADHPQFVTLHVRPHADLAALRDVYVVVPLEPGRARRGGGTP